MLENNSTTSALIIQWKKLQHFQSKQMFVFSKTQFNVYIITDFAKLRNYPKFLAYVKDNMFINVADDSFHY